MHDDIHIKLTSRHVAFLIGLTVGFFFWGVRQAFGDTLNLGITPLDHVIDTTASATSAFLASASASSPLVQPDEPIYTPTIPEPDSSALQTTVIDLSKHHFRVGLQVGHLENQHPPAELGFIAHNTGAVGGGTTEPAVGLRVALLTKKLLEREGVTVDILPAVVPPGYQADAFIAIHCDGSEKPEISGYKIAPSVYDQSGSAALLSTLILNEYGKVTHMPQDDKITPNMTQYYAFAAGRIEHSISPYTPGVLLETGFLTNAQDQEVLVKHPERAAHGLANGITAFLQVQK